MSRPDDTATAELLSAVGITSTDAGRAKARARLAAAEQKWSRERRAQLRDAIATPDRAA